MSESELIVALDVASADEAVAVCSELIDDVHIFKVGLRLFCAEGPRVIGALKGLGAAVFLDLKLHDIPAQVKQASFVLGGLDVDMITVHCLGGTEMLKAAKQGATEGAKNSGCKVPAVLGVTILTSLDSGNLEALGVNNQVEVEVRLLAGMAHDSGLDGVVASAREIKAIKSEFSEQLKVVTPGIRPLGTDENEDQKRVVTPAVATRDGADYLVVGRPITQADDPREAALAILSQMRQT